MTITLGLDLATASARCVALDTETGALLASAEEPLPQPVRTSGGVSRQRSTYAAVAHSLLAQVCRVLGSAAQGVAALSVTGTSGTVVPCGVDGTAIGDARLYDDTSAAADVAELDLALAPSLARMLSLHRELQPAQLLSTADVVAASLVGAVVAADTSHHLKAGIDLEWRRWPTAAMTQLGLPTDQLPDLVPPGAVLGVVSPAVASGIGLPAGVRVVAGMTDGCTAQLGAGAVRPGDSLGVLGTTLVLKAVSTANLSAPGEGLYSHLSPAGDYWPGGASNSGAGVLDAQFPRRHLAELDRAAAERGPSSIVRYPLSRPGERFPVADPGLASLSSGEPVDDIDAYRAVLDGVAFVERLGLETLGRSGVTHRRHALAGGAARSAVWNTIRSTVLGPVVPEVVQARGASSASGAAVLAAYALDREAAGDRASLADTVTRLVPTPAPVPADHAEAGRLEESYGRFRSLLAARTPPAPAISAVPAPSPEWRSHHV